MSQKRNFHCNNINVFQAELMPHYDLNVTTTTMMALQITSGFSRLHFLDLLQPTRNFTWLILVNNPSMASLDFLFFVFEKYYFLIYFVGISFLVHKYLNRFARHVLLLLCILFLHLALWPFVRKVYCLALWASWA